LDLNLLNHDEACIEVGERANKEFSIENMLKEMKDIWEGIFF